MSLLASAERMKRRHEVAREVAALEADDTDRAEMLAVASVMDPCVQRGDVFRFKVPKGLGHERQGERYGLVIQSDALLSRSVVVVAPTSRSARPASFRPEVQVSRSSTRVLVEQLGAVDVQRLGRRVGHLTASEMWAVDEALLTVLDLD